MHSEVETEKQLRLLPSIQ